MFLKTILNCFWEQFCWELKYKQQFSRPILCEDTMHSAYSTCFQLFFKILYKKHLKAPQEAPSPLLKPSMGVHIPIQGGKRVFWAQEHGAAHYALQTTIIFL